MNRNNIWGHLAVALALILVAAFAGWVRKLQREGRFTSKFERSNSYSREREFANDDGDTGNVEVLVRFRPGITQEAIEGIVARLHDEVEDRIEAVDGLEVIEDETGKDADTVAQEYRALPEVEYAEPNYEITADREMKGGAKPVHPGDPMFNEQWALDNSGQRGGKAGADISAMRAWAVTRGSEEIVVAVLDSGVDYTHPDLAKNIWTRPENIEAYADGVDDVHGYNAVDQSGDPMDDNGHGTHCAGIIGAEGGNDFGIAGINWNVKIMPLKFMSAGGTGTTVDAIECINYAIDRKHDGVNLRVISASWGSRQKSRALEDVIRKAYDEGILFVAASGNTSSNNDRAPHYPASFNLGNVISVAALNRNDELASFSNYGPKSVHLAAPGAEILSTWLRGGFEEHSGTSMAAPMVAGVAALILSEEPGLSVDELRAKLLKSVDKLPALSGKVASGGRINAAKAVGAG